MTETVSGRALSQIGIGTYGVGGRGHRNKPVTEKESDKKYIDALIYALEKDSNFTEISLGYGHGQALKLFKQALSNSSLNREDVFITHSLYPADLTSVDTMSQDIVEFYRVMGTEYADSTLITQLTIIRFGESAVFDILHKLLREDKTRFVSLSNASPDWIRKFKAEFGDKFFAHEGHLSFEVRALQDKGVFSTCNQLGVENIIWRPLRRNLTLLHNWPLLIELSKKYGKTQSQLILNWICKQGYKTMVFSTDPSHIDENLSAANLQMSDEDYKRIADFKLSNYHPPAVDWEGPGIDDDILVLVKDFEQHWHE
jgi:diketogulonate reductase-like aldo/keto reductase